MSKKHNKQRFPANEEQLAEQTVRVLESRTPEVGSKDDQATAELGRLLRDAAEVNLPESNVDLREQLMAELDGGSPAVGQVTVASGEVASSEVASGKRGSESTGRRRFWVAAAASGLLLVGGAIAYNSGFVGQLSNVAMLESPRESDNDSVDSLGASSIPEQVLPEVVFHYETKTRAVPTQRARTETKTRQVPVTKVREETKRVKQSDGSFKEETVKVPYTEQVTQSYTVQVPYTENVSQSYSVQVPYTADGKRIEKADYGKYGLDDGGEGRGTLAPANEMVFPDTDDWSQSFRRTEYQGELAGRHDPSGAKHDSKSNGRTSGLGIQGQKRPAAHGMWEQMNEGASLSSDSESGQLHDSTGDFGGQSLGGFIAGVDPFQPGKAGGKLQRTAGEASADRRSQGFVGTGRPGGDVDSSVVKGVNRTVLEVATRRRLIEYLQRQRDQKSLGLNDAEIDALDSGGVVGRESTEGRKLELDELESLVIEDKIVSELASFSTVFDRDFKTKNGRDQVAAERRIIEQLELQRDKQIVNGKFGPGCTTFRALDLAINERKQRLNALLRSEANSGEQYAPIFENAFIGAKGPEAISTFSIDVDTASYANMRRLLNSGQRPPANSIRLEELVNYFQYGYDQPTGDHPFSVNLELAGCPWQDGHQLLRVGLKGKDIHVAERPATNVVFLIDVSGSMSSNDKLPLLKSGFQMMSQQLGENDRVSIVTYAGNAGVVLTPTNGTQTETINNAIERLSSGGSTHGSAGIQLAYELAQQNFIEGGVNRVMLATDGDLNVGVTSDDALVSLIKEKAAEGVFLTVLGFGSGNLKDAKLEKLADNGNGMYAYIDSTREARRVLVDQLSGSLVTIAKDVKIQVEFNPAEVKSYRLLGYENRMLETKDFDDDRKDAGEIGAGHTVTAIYQIEPAKVVQRSVSLPAGMKYQVQAGGDLDAPVAGQGDVGKDGLSTAAMSGELATVALRYKQPDASESQRLEVSVKNVPRRFEDASSDFRFAASVAGFGMYLRGSKHRGSINADQLQRIASGAIGDDEAGYRAEFIDLIRKASGR